MISSQSLSYAYPRTPPLQFPDVDVPQGAVLLLSGPSGSGKSTWLSLVAGLVAPSAGHLQVAGQDMGALSQLAADAWRARHLGFLPQKLHLSSALTVQENLALAYWAAGLPVDSARIAQCLDELGIAALAARKPAQLSGGQAQRVALARSVLHHPQVLLADEPTASLDDEAAADAVSLLEGTAHAHGATLVIATHDRRVEALLQTRLGAKNDATPANILRVQLSKQERLQAVEVSA
ncbi:ATP-binding cassette domain-containing protein [Curvibacter sp. APW13]|uniref:ABC transporter ATP-binding protein n=1 Tax=Curvibacter sp. APW13 TaxID=3077236 RepID=UPI0028DFFF12|nr:ATP-binding cassette domain-containing protein [Curvibacter sp. APW13]MDT8990188.1 ATP-binding cassette domain-containing protein [Curvibacter sp. APW13]